MIVHQVESILGRMVENKLDQTVMSEESSFAIIQIPSIQNKVRI